MSRYYEMAVEIKGYEVTRADAIQEAAEVEWHWEEDGWSEYKINGRLVEPTCMFGHGRSNLGSGESEGEFAHRLRIAIWRANAAYCEVEVTATYLEDLPCEFYGSTKEQYEKAKADGLLEPEKEGEDNA